MPTKKFTKSNLSIEIIQAHHRNVTISRRDLQFEIWIQQLIAQVFLATKKKEKQCTEKSQHIQNIQVN